jgi:hypothetical protein
LSARPRYCIAVDIIAIDRGLEVAPIWSSRKDPESVPSDVIVAAADHSAIVGHHDRKGLKETRHMMSWNSSHGSAGCSQDALKKTGGAGLFYCFAAD